MINNYYYMVGIITSQNRTDALQRDKITEIRNGILPSKYYALFVRQPDPHGNIFFKANDSLNNQLFAMQENGEKQIDRYINHLLDRRARLVNIVGTYYPVANDIALNIINTLKAEYKLK